MRRGQYIFQPTGYRAFIPSPLPPNPPIKIDGFLHQLLSDANIALGRLDTMGYLLPAVLSSQIEGTQASLEDIFEYESPYSS